MSLEAGSYGAIALGVVLMVVGSITAPYGGWSLIFVGAGLLTAGALGLIFQPKAPSQRAARGGQLEIATASEGFPVPVIFGEQKVTGNFMRWEKEQFRTVKIYGQPTAGGKGGSDVDAKNVQGFDYYLQFEYALCMGPVDSCMQVWSTPGEFPMRALPLIEAAFADNEEYIELSLNKQHETGIVRLWRGTSDQTRVNPSGSDKYVADWLRAINVTNGGADYSANSKATITGDGSGAEVTLDISGGVIQAVRINNTGYGYTFANIVLSHTGTGAGATFAIQLASGTMNYRNLCYALFGPGNGYRIGRVPSPKSYAFILRRLPGTHADDGTNKVMRRDDGTIIDGFRNRGSGDATKSGFFQANPAAIVYEILTNKLWGRALPSSIIDEDSFVYASEYFYDRHIGMSMTLESAERIVDVLDSIRAHLRTILIWDGETLKLRVLMDPATTHENILTLSENEISDLKVQRSDWVNTINEVRAEFNSLHRNYRPDVIHIQDLANIQLVGRINPTRIQLSGFTDFNIAYKQTQRILRELSYPLAHCTFNQNMFKSRIEVGDVFRLIWNEYGAGTQTTYFQCVKKKEAAPGSEEVMITAVEDIDLSAVDAEELTVAVPDKQPWEEIPDFNIEALSLFVVPGTENTAISPIIGFELSPIITRGKKELIFLGQKNNEGVTGFKIFWKQDNPNFRFLENYDSFAITGALATSISGSDAFDRTPEGAFEFSLIDVETDEAALLAACSRVVLPTDSLEDLLDEGGAYLFVDEECMQIGYVEKVDTNRYRAFNVIRGVLGTTLAVHSRESFFYFVNEIPLRVRARDDQKVMDIGKITEFKASPQGTIEATEVGTPFHIFHDGDQNQKFLGVGARPLPPIAVEIADSSDPSFPGKEITLRPRQYMKGADTGPFFDVIKDMIPNAETMDFVMQQLDVNGNFCVDPSLLSWEVAGVVLAPRGAGAGGSRVNRRPDYLYDRTGGTVTFYGIKPETDCVEIRIFSVFAGQRSVEYASFYP